MFVNNEDDNVGLDDHVIKVVEYLHNTNDVITRVSRHKVLNESESEFYDHVVKIILDEDEANKHLPVP
eukprot:9212572-Ditylum_brightwellii.AAC.1